MSTYRFNFLNRDKSGWEFMDSCEITARTFSGAVAEFNKRYKIEFRQVVRVNPQSGRAFIGGPR
ncbi:MAG: hypothetical protein COA75_02990 [Cellvibrionales bacterium]|nr:MAG: hypothetical protein COA75_02990 [Cellvibrionales bacterium]